MMLMENYFRFPGFLTKACTLSYDDGATDDIKLIEIMRKYGLKGTFNLNSSLTSGTPDRLTVEQIKEVFGDDTEIALHGYNHLSLAKVTPPLAMRDVISDREFLEKSFGRVVRGMAYANSSVNDTVLEILKLSGIAYSRNGSSTESFALPEDWLRLCPTCHHNNPRLFELVDEFLNGSDGKFSWYFWAKKPRLFYLYGHSFEFPRDNNWDRIEEFGRIMSERNDVWHATNMEIYKYVEAFKRLVFSADGNIIENPSAIDVYINVIDNDVLVKAGSTVSIAK